MSKRGHEQPLRDNSRPPDLFNGIAAEVESEPADDVTEEPVAGIKPVAEIIAEHDARLAQKAARWEELTAANWPPGRIDQTLGTEFPDLISPEQIEEIDKSNSARRRRELKESAPAPRSKPVRYISPRDSGPPQHVADEISGKS